MFKLIHDIFNPPAKHPLTLRREVKLATERALVDAQQELERAIFTRDMLLARLARLTAETDKDSARLSTLGVSSKALASGVPDHTPRIVEGPWAEDFALARAAQAQDQPQEPPAVRLPVKLDDVKLRNAEGALLGNLSAATDNERAYIIAAINKDAP
jgi:hypothetical protein